MIMNGQDAETWQALLLRIWRHSGEDGWIDLHWVRALMVPMHLGLINGPFVPHDLDIIGGEPCTAPRVKILISAGSKKETQIYRSLCVQILLYLPSYITLFINVYWSPRKRNSLQNGENKRSPSTEPQVDRRPT
jgi:hypothetical protein